MNIITVAYNPNPNVQPTAEELEFLKDLLAKIRNDQRFDMEQKTHVLYVQRAVMDVARKLSLKVNNNPNYY
jgi:hypothetical protein